MTRDQQTTATQDTLVDLEQRLMEKQATLEVMADRHHDQDERTRLWGKAAGVGLALSFVRELQRGALNGSSPQARDD